MREHTASKARSPGLLVCYGPLAVKLSRRKSLYYTYERWRFGFISNTASTRRSVSRRRASHCSLSDSPQTIP